MPTMFRGAFLKLERANQHIRDLQDVFQSFADSQPHRTIIKAEVQGGKVVQVGLEIDFSAPLPDSLALILGDAVHNLRSALDHAVWELIVIDGGTPDRWTKLPVAETRQSYEAFARGMKTPRHDTKQFLIDLEVYPGGLGEALYTLSRLDNADKHSILTPVAQASSVSGLVFINRETGERQEAATLRTQPSFDKSVRVLRTLPNWAIDTEQDPYATPAIFFGDIEIFPYEPIIPTLSHLSESVAETLAEFATFVSLRGALP